MTTRTVDYRALTEPLDARAYRRWRTARIRVRGSRTTVVTGLAIVAFSLLLILSAGFVFGRHAEQPIVVKAWTLALIGLVLAGIAATVILVVAHRSRRDHIRTYRYLRFAPANGMDFDEDGGPAPASGTLFDLRTEGTVLERFVASDGLRFETGRYRYRIGVDDKRLPVSWGYLMLDLDREVPHLLLDAKGNDSLLGARLPRAFRGVQQLSLEGDFDQHFTLYCPKGYERDALYIFTPDLMALLIEHSGDLDVELVDQRLLLYSRTPFDYGSPATWDRLFAIMDLVGARTAHRVHRYRDDRVGTAEDSPSGASGRRLRHAISWRSVFRSIAASIAVLIALFAVVVVMWLVDTAF